VKKARSFLRVVNAIIWKDLTAELRSRELVSAMLVFALLIILIFNFALELNQQTQAGLTSGILWVTLIFAGTIGLNRSMAVEKDRGCLDGLLLAPVDRTAIYFGKVAANWLFTILVALIVLPLFAILFTVNLIVPGLILCVILGTAGYSIVGTLLSAMAVQTRTRDILLPILLFPVIFPLLLAVVKATSGFLQLLPWMDVQPWMTLIVVYDMIFTAVGILVFDSVVEE
jgi:heme exporter protein B